MSKPEQSMRSSRLGRGLASLIVSPVEVQASPSAADSGVIEELRLDEVRPNSSQPRRTFVDSTIDELAASIRSVGVMQPILVRPIQGVSRGTNPAFEIVAGERRWRAAKLAGLDRVPAIVRPLDDQTAAEWSLIENIQREDLNAMDRAEAFQKLIDEHGFTQQQIADRVGIDRSSVSNHLRLLSLDDRLKDAVRAGQISFGHARCMLSLSSPELASRAMVHAIDDGWSVRQLEKWVADEIRRLEDKEPETYKHSPNIEHVENLEKRLSQHLGTKVQIKLGRRRGTGALNIEFYTLEQFDGLLARLGFNNAS